MLAVEGTSPWPSKASRRASNPKNVVRIPTLSGDDVLNWRLPVPQAAILQTTQSLSKVEFASHHVSASNPFPSTHRYSILADA